VEWIKGVTSPVDDGSISGRHSLTGIIRFLVSSVLPTVSLTLHTMLLETPIQDENKPHKSDFEWFIV
jgi:hypothetical protein